MLKDLLNIYLNCAGFWYYFDYILFYFIKLDGFYYYTFGNNGLFSILYSLYIIIDNQEVILFKLSEQGNLKYCHRTMRAEN